MIANNLLVGGAGEAARRKFGTSYKFIHANTQKRKQTASILAPKPPPQRSQIAIANIAKLESKTVDQQKFSEILEQDKHREWKFETRYFVLK